MELPFSIKVSVTAVDAMILAYGQLIQPTSADEIYEFSSETLISKSFTKDEFHDRFRQLERDGLFWRTAENQYVVTPKGDFFARKSLNGKRRDKLRLVILNKQRYSR